MPGNFLELRGKTAELLLNIAELFRIQQRYEM